MITKLSDFIRRKGSILLFAKTLRAVMTLWREAYGVRKFDADAILYGDTQCKKMDISMF